MPGESGEPTVTTLVCFLFCMRGCGRVERPAFPAPSEFQMRFTLPKLARTTRRECRGVCVLHPSSREAVGSRRAKLGLGWHIASGANDVTGGGLFPQARHSRTCVGCPHPALRATLPTKGHKRGRDKKDQACARNEARSPDERSEIRGVCPQSFPDIATTGSERDTYCPRNRCNDDVVELIQKHCSSWRPGIFRRIRQVHRRRGR